MTEDEPLRCQSCDHNVPRDRREDFGDACERWKGFDDDGEKDDGE